MEKSAGVVIIYQNKILLVHPSSSTRYYGNYSFPKGHIEENETALSAALREVKEEVGIKLKSSQLDRKMYEIPYIAKKNKKDIPKGSIYKTVYYWTCTIENLNEIGLSSEVVPKNQLQAAEVNWAGFVPANEIEQRIAPVMKSIIKHVNMKSNEDKQEIRVTESFNIKSLGDFITERKYLKKSDINWEKSEPYILQDLKYMIRHALPYDWRESEKYIASIEDKSIEDKGVKFEITLKNKDIITAYKTSKFAGDWEYYLNGKKAGKRGTRDELSKLFYERLTDLEKYIKKIKAHDFHYLYADDHRAYRSGSNSSDSLVELYSKLSGSDKRKAYNEYLKHAPKDKHVSFNEFSGL
jgi:8-oxo-dGTP pyrophosphatase MutT (NUDIX family)